MRAGGHERSGAIGDPPTLSGYSPNVLVTCCTWRFGRCMTRHVLGCKQKCSEKQASTKPRKSMPFLLSTSRLYAPNTLLSASPPPSPLCVSQTEDAILKRHRRYGAVERCHVTGLLPLRRFLGRGIGYFIKIRVFRRRVLMQSIAITSLPEFSLISSFIVSPTPCCPFFTLTPLQSTLN